MSVRRIWCGIVTLACELLAWTQMLGVAAHPARRWEPKRLRLRLFAVAGRIALHAHRLVIDLAADHRFSDLVLTAPAAITGPGRCRAPADRPTTPHRPRTPTPARGTRRHRPRAAALSYPPNRVSPDPDHRAGNDHHRPTPARSIRVKAISNPDRRGLAILDPPCSRTEAGL